MSSGVPLNPARRTKSYAAAAVADVDGVMAGGATLTTADTLTAEDFDGAAMSEGGVLDLPRSITITLGSNPGAFTPEEPWVLTGTRGGITVTAEFEPTTADGAETLRATQAFDKLTSLAIPEQADTDGTYTIGVEDICAPAGDTFVGVELAADDTLNVKYGEGANAPTDAIPVTVARKSFYSIAPTRVVTNASLSAATNVGLTVYLA